MRSYKTEGIIIKRVNYGEADRILTIFSKHYGKIRIIAKGVRKINSKRGGNLELFNYVKIVLAEGKIFDSLCEVEVKESFPLLKRNLKKVAIVYYLCELIDRLCPEKQENSEIFEYFYKVLKELEEKNFQKISIRDFAIFLLKELGYLDKNKSYSKANIRIFIENLLGKDIKSDRIIRQIL